MMQVNFTVEGATFADLQQKMDQAVQSFLTGAESGTTATLIQVNAPATKIDDTPAGWDVASGKVLTLPKFQLTYTWDIVSPSEPTEQGQTITVD